MEINMNQSNTPNKHTGISFRYSSMTRTLVCLGQTFENVAPFEIEKFTAAAFKHDQQARYKQQQARKDNRQHKPATKRSDTKPKPNPVERKSKPKTQGKKPVLKS
jgi:hypothetical protein